MLDVGGIDTVNGFNGNLSIHIPIGGSYPVGGQMGAYSFSLVYNSNVWDHVGKDGPGCAFGNMGATDTLAISDPYSNAGLGWRLALGNIGNHNYDAIDGTMAPRPGNNTYRGMDGAEHTLFGAGSLESSDGSYMRFKEAAQELEFPDGTVHTFNPADQGYPSLIKDRFGNGMEITYEWFAAPNAGIPSVWTISDGSRTHRVYFRLTGYGTSQRTNEQRAVLDRIELASFDGEIATYKFLYNNEDELGGGRQEVRMTGFGTQIRTCPFVAWQPRVFLLTKVILPDRTTYSMPVADYQSTAGHAGPIRRLGLPTGGAIAWDYEMRAMPQPRPDELHVWTLPAWSFVLGVNKRQIFKEGGQLLGEWLYSAAFDTNPLWNELVRQVVYPDQHRVVTYYSACAYTTCINEAGAPDSPSNTFATDYGLPFSRRRSNDGSGRFLSQEVFKSTSDTEPLRRVYVAYENDGIPNPPPCNVQPDCFNASTNLNQRLQSQRTVYLDDRLPPLNSNVFASVVTDSSGYDGLGHYRIVTTSDNFSFPGTTRIETTNWNPQGRPAASQPWVLNTFDFQRQQEAYGDDRQEFDFEPGTGFLRCKRNQKINRSHGPFDVIVTYDHADPSLPGQVTSEKWFGGDTSKLPASAGCSSPSDLPAPVYAYVHDYSFGVRKRTYVNTTYTAPTGGVGQLNLLDLDIDPGTGLAKVSRDSAGRQTLFNYDSMGRIKSSTPQGDAATTIDYHPEQYVPSLVDLTIGNSTTLEHEQWAIDGVGRVIGDSLSMPGNRSSSSLTFYDAMGRKTFVTERGSANGTSFLSYDSFGRPTSIQTADGKMTTVEYQGVRIVNRTPKVWNGIGEVRATTREDYDGLGRLRSVRDPKKTLTRYVYDAAGRLKKATTSPPTGPPQVRSFNYDGRGFLTSDVQPESGTTSYKYDARGNVKMRATPTATLWSKYDEAGRLVRVYTPSQSDMKLLAYRADGKLASARAFNYRSEGAACPRYEVRQDFTYFDATHGRLSSEDTTLSKLGISSPLEKWSQSYLYDGAGRVTQATYPYCRLATCAAAARSRTTTFDMGRPTKVTGFASAITYNDSESVHTIQHENGVTFTQNPDSSGMIRPGSIQVSGPEGVLWPEEKYIYDGSGNLAKIGPGTIGAATGKKFAYDLNSRLISAIFPVSPAIPAGLPHYQGYTYDAYGNLTVVKTGQSATDSTSVTYGAEAATNRLPPGPVPYGAIYDGGGNLTSYQGSSYSWDSLQNLATVNTGTEAWVHTYDVAGERVWSWRTTGSRVDTFALRGQGGEVLSDFTKDGSSSPATYTWEDYAYREGQLLGAVRPGGQLVHFDVDHLGSVRLETGINGVLINYREFWPYGDIASTLPTTPQDAEQMKFTGHERDIGNAGSTADDLDYMHARYYRPLQGRFLSPDPMNGAPALPQSWNRYSYVKGNPLRFTDPTGRVDSQCDGDGKCAEPEPEPAPTPAPEPTPAPTTPDGKLQPPPRQLPPGPSGEPNQWVYVPNKDPGPKQRPGRWKPLEPIPNPTGAQPGASWDPKNGHWDVDVPNPSGKGKVDRERYLPDGTPLGPDHRPLDLKGPTTLMMVGTAAYWIISEGLRIFFPLRNLAPIP